MSNITPSKDSASSLSSFSSKSEAAAFASAFAATSTGNALKKASTSTTTIDSTGWNGRATETPTTATTATTSDTSSTTMEPRDESHPHSPQQHPPTIAPAQATKTFENTASKNTTCRRNGTHLDDLDQNNSSRHTNNHSQSDSDVCVVSAVASKQAEQRTNEEQNSVSPNKSEPSLEEPLHHTLEATAQETSSTSSNGTGPGDRDNEGSPGLLGVSLASPKQTTSEDQEHSPETPDYHTILTQFYEKHNPSKLNSVAATVKKYQGRERDMFAKLALKYAVANPLDTLQDPGRKGVATASPKPPPIGTPNPSPSSTTAKPTEVPSPFASQKDNQSLASVPETTPAQTSQPSFGAKATNQQPGGFSVRSFTSVPTPFTHPLSSKPGGFSFGSSITSAPTPFTQPLSSSKPGGFSFGSSISTSAPTPFTQPLSSSKPDGFSFGSSITSAPTPFTQPLSSKPASFSFGSSITSAPTPFTQPLSSPAPWTLPSVNRVSNLSFGQPSVTTSARSNAPTPFSFPATVSKAEPPTNDSFAASLTPATLQPDPFSMSELSYEEERLRYMFKRGAIKTASKSSNGPGVSSPNAPTPFAFPATTSKSEPPTNESLAASLTPATLQSDPSSKPTEATVTATKTSSKSSNGTGPTLSSPPAAFSVPATANKSQPSTKLSSAVHAEFSFTLPPSQFKPSSKSTTVASPTFRCPVPPIESKPPSNSSIADPPTFSFPPTAAEIKPCNQSSSTVPPIFSFSVPSSTQSKPEGEALAKAQQQQHLREEQRAAEKAAKEQAERAAAVDYIGRAEKLVAQLKLLQESVEPFNKSKPVERRRLEMKKIVNGKVNTLSEDADKIRTVAGDVAAAIKKAKGDDLQIQEQIKAGNGEYSPEMAKGKRYFVDLLCSKVIIRVQAEGFNGQRGDGFPLAHMLTMVSVEHKDVIPVLAAHVYTVCHAAIPRLPKITEDATDDEVMETLGMLRGKDGNFETFERFLARTEGLVSIIANIMSSEPAEHTLFGGNQGAVKWLSRFLSELPEPPVSPLPLITAPVLDAFLTGAGHMLANTFPDEFKKCLEKIQTNCLPRLDEGAVGKPSATSLRKTLDGGFESFKTTLPSRALGELYHGSSATGTRKPISSAPGSLKFYQKLVESNKDEHVIVKLHDLVPLVANLHHLQIYYVFVNILLRQDLVTTNDVQHFMQKALQATFTSNVTKENKATSTISDSLKDMQKEARLRSCRIVEKCYTDGILNSGDFQHFRSCIMEPDSREECSWSSPLTELDLGEHLALYEFRLGEVNYRKDDKMLSRVKLLGWSLKQLQNAFWEGRPIDVAIASMCALLNAHAMSHEQDPQSSALPANNESPAKRQGMTPSILSCIVDFGDVRHIESVVKQTEMTAFQPIVQQGIAMVERATDAHTASRDPRTDILVNITGQLTHAIQQQSHDCNHNDHEKEEEKSVLLALVVAAKMIQASEKQDQPTVHDLDTKHKTGDKLPLNVRLERLSLTERENLIQAPDEPLDNEMVDNYNDKEPKTHTQPAVLLSEQGDAPPKLPLALRLQRLEEMMGVVHRISSLEHYFGSSIPKDGSKDQELTLMDRVTRLEKLMT